MLDAFGFREIWVLDTEFSAPPGERSTPHCLVARELVSGRVVRTWLAGVSASSPPFEVGRDVLCIAFFSSAEWGCFLALGWPLPVHVVDMYAEFRCLTNGADPAHGNGLFGALHHLGLPTIDAQEKQTMRALAIRGGPFSPAETGALLDYCESDVRALALLCEKMLPLLDWPRALLRGRYMKAVARMEWTGIPIDVGLHVQLTEHWSDIKHELIDFAAARFPVFLDGHFNHALFERFLVERDMRWPFTARGRAAVDQQSFKDMARIYPEILPLQQTLHALGKLRLTDLAVGADGRNRTLLSPFSSRTSRNQPSTSRYVFGLAAWMRALIKPPPGRALACLDFEQQEFGIGAALSGDDGMMAAYATGDPYLAFAKQAGAVPDGATKKTHAPIRERFKSCALGVQYGMGDNTLSDRTGQSPAHARELIEAHRRTYPRYWRWVEAAVDFAMLHGRIDTVFGWRQLVGSDANPRSLQNFPCQANGAEMLRLACSFATERGVLVGGPIHDALLIEASESDIEARVLEARAAMADASRVVLGGFELRTEAKIIRYPDRYIDDRGRETWQQVNEFLKRFKH